MDADQITERLLWLETQGLTIAVEARRLRRRVPRVALVDADELAREVARLGVVARVREDEVAIWCVDPTPTSTPPRVVPMPAPLRQWWWPW